MSKRSWRKSLETRARARSGEQPVTLIPVGRITGPSGKHRVTTVCPECSSPTTELWPCVDGKLRCPRCGEDASMAIFACLQEYDGDERLTHLVAAEPSGGGAIEPS